MSERIRVRLTGKVMCEFTRYMTIPKDELVNFGDEEGIQCNMFPDECSIEVVEWEDASALLFNPNPHSPLPIAGDVNN